MHLRLKTGESADAVGVIGYHVQVVCPGRGPGTLETRLVLPEECDDEPRFWTVWRAFGGLPEIEESARG